MEHRPTMGKFMTDGGVDRTEVGAADHIVEERRQGLPDGSSTNLVEEAKVKAEVHDPH